MTDVYYSTFFNVFYSCHVFTYFNVFLFFFERFFYIYAMFLAISLGTLSLTFRTSLTI